RGLCAFLGEEFDQALLRPSRIPAPPGLAQPWPAAHDAAIDPGAAGRWKHELSSDALALFDAEAGATLRSLGYARDATPRLPTPRERVTGRAADMLAQARWRATTWDRVPRATTTLRLGRARLLRAAGLIGGPGRVALDLTALLPERTGVDTYMLGMVHALAEQDGDAHYTVFVKAGDEAPLAGLPGRVHVRPPPRRPRPVRLAFQQAFLPAFVAARGIDVVHSPAFISPLVCRGARHVVTIHDLTSFSLPEAHTRLRRSSAYRMLVARTIRRADAVSVPSEWVAADVRRRFPEVAPERVRVHPPGIGEAFRPRSAEEVRAPLSRLALQLP